MAKRKTPAKSAAAAKPKAVPSPERSLAWATRRVQRENGFAARRV
jgi:hypothetical protein